MTLVKSDAGVPYFYIFSVVCILVILLFPATRFSIQITCRVEMSVNLHSPKINSRNGGLLFICNVNICKCHFCRGP